MTRPRASVFLAASLDGFIARRDGGIDWLAIVERPDDAPPAERTIPGGEAMDPLWSLCYGDCLRDDWGNLLEDRAQDGRDVLRYDYGCW